MLCDIVIIFQRKAHVPIFHAVSHVDHAKGVAWFSISMYACGSVPICRVMVLRLTALWTTRALLQILINPSRSKIRLA